jgi:hypothetical protein
VFARAVIAAAVVLPAFVGGVIAGGGGSTTEGASAPAATAAARVLGARAQAIDTAIGELNAARLTGRRRLLQSSTPAAQAARAADLARAYDAALRAVGAVPVNDRQGTTAPIAAALTRARVAYLQLASTARRGDRAGYDQARRAVASSESALGTALAAPSP